jgi:serine/threonine protein phosphatase PrpC
MQSAANAPLVVALDQASQLETAAGFLVLGFVLGALFVWATTDVRRSRGAHTSVAAEPATAVEPSVHSHGPPPATSEPPLANVLARVPPAALGAPDFPPPSEYKIARLYGAAPRHSRAQGLGKFGPHALEDDDEGPGPSDSHVVVSYEEEAEEEEATSPLARILVSARCESDRGRKRRANHDSLLFVPEFSLFAVADGMGDAADGQVASSLAVETLRQAFERESFVGDLRSEKPIPRRGRELASSMLQANWAVFEAARVNPALTQIGTTLVTARFSPNKQRLYIGNVGDSRCYRLRVGALRQLTTDHTMGVLGLRGPRAKDLLQAIGVTADLSIDLIVDKPRPNDLYLLCSDGLPKMVSDREIQRVLTEEPDLDAAVHALIHLANDNGGTDNVTVILVKVVERVFKPVLAFPGVESAIKPGSVHASRTRELAANARRVDAPARRRRS